MSISEAVQNNANIEKTLVHPMERLYFGLSFVISTLIYAYLMTEKTGLYYVAAATVLSLALRGMYLGNIRSNGIRVSELQFPEVHRLAANLVSRMHIDSVPTIYVLQQGGVLNALATRMVGVNYIVIYSDVLELAYEQGEKELEFIICHELAHIKRHHITWRMLFTPAMLFFSDSYARACEYTCDRYGSHYCPDGAIGGLIVLAAGKKLYRQVVPSELGRQAELEKSLWVSMSESFSSHPPLSKRLNALGLELPSRPVGSNIHPEHDDQLPQIPT